jgi:hypothetical protein
MDLTLNETSLTLNIEALTTMTNWQLTGYNLN